MCTSLADGGMRCAAHTRPAYQQAMERMGERARTPDLYHQMHRNGWEFTEEATAVYHDIREFASTPQGEKEVLAEANALTKVGGKLNKFALLMKRARIEGVDLHQFRKEATAVVKKEAVAVARRANNSMVEMKADPRMTFERSHAAKYPELAAMWSPTLNKGVSPDQVAPKKNAEVWLVCEKGHEFSGRLNNYANGWDRGNKPSCPECKPRRQAAFKSTQEELAAVVAALGDDPDAFNALSPALQYALMEKMGLMRGDEDSMRRMVSMSIVRGDITLKEAVAAKELDSIENRMHDADADDTLATVTDFNDVNEVSVSASSPVDDVMASAGTLALLDPDSDLAQDIMRENVTRLWAQATTQDADIETIVASVNAGRGKSAHANALADRFITELRAVQNAPNPDGYQTLRVDTHGVTKTMEPTLAQKRFMAMVETDRRVMNWSDTGAGKTLAATLAVQQAGARETLVVCPLAVVDQWKPSSRTGSPPTLRSSSASPTPPTHSPRPHPA